MIRNLFIIAGAGLVLSTGPLSVPAFTAYGLVKGAFLSTEAASSPPRVCDGLRE